MLRSAALVALLIGFSTAAYAQKSITITGIPSAYNGKIAMLVLAPAVSSQSYIAYSLTVITGASTTFSLSDWATDGPWTGSGNFAFTILIYDNQQAAKENKYTYSGQTASTVSVSYAATTIQWAQFGSGAQQPAQQPAPQQPAPQQPAAPPAAQKSITVTGIPNTYRGKIGFLALAPSPSSQTYTAYSIATISGSSVTFPLSDWTTDGPWGGSGNFAFAFLIGENTQTLSNKQYLYAGQTAATSSVSQTTTTIQWSQFIAMASQPAAQQPAPEQPAPQQPAPRQPAPRRPGR